MPRYLTQHTLACLTRQGAENLAQRMQYGGTARAERVLVNMLEGMHFDWLVRIEWETRAQDGKLYIAE
jgi:hypothetical protein